MFLAIVSFLSLFLCSVLIGNGFSPVFAVMKATRRSTLPWIGLAIFFAVKIVFDSASHVLPFTLMQYPIWAACYLLAKRSALLSATAFYILSNTACFFTMNGNIPSMAMYTPDFAGYITCMAAGIPFYLRSIVATVIFDIAIKWALRRAPAELAAVYIETRL